MNTLQKKASSTIKRRDTINFNKKESLSSSDIKYTEIDYVSSEI